MFACPTQYHQVLQSVNTFGSVTFWKRIRENCKVDKADKRKALLEHRLKRLIELRHQACNGNAAEFSRRIGVNETYAVRMFWSLDTKGRKGLGPEMEARVREAFNLSPGWFDLPLGTDLPISNKIGQPPPEDYYTNMDEESRLLRAYRLADPPVRRNLLRQADGILEDLDNPSQLNGTEKPSPG